MPRHNPAASGGTVVLDAPPAAPAASPTPASPTPVSQQPTAGKTGLKKVSFGAIATKKDDTKTAYPVFPDADSKAAEIAARIKERTEQFESLKGAIETDKAELKFLVAPYYFQVNHGRHEVPSSIAIKYETYQTGDGGTVARKVGSMIGNERPIGTGEVLVTFQNRYPLLPDEDRLVDILGVAVTQSLFRQSFELKIKGDKLPTDRTQDLMNDLQNLFARYNCTDALEVKEGVKPTDDFHAARHVQLTPETNLALEQACPIVAMVKTKGRK